MNDQRKIKFTEDLELLYSLSKRISKKPTRHKRGLTNVFADFDGITWWHALQSVEWVIDCQTCTLCVSLTTALSHDELLTHDNAITVPEKRAKITTYFVPSTVKSRSPHFPFILDWPWAQRFLIVVPNFVASFKPKMRSRCRLNNYITIK